MEDDGNATDADQASLPEDPTGASKTKPKPPTRKPSCTDSVASTRSEIPVIKISEEVEGIKNPKPGTSAQHMTRTRSKVDPEKKKRLLKALIKQTKVKIKPLTRKTGKSVESDGLKRLKQVFVT